MHVDVAQQRLFIQTGSCWIWLLGPLKAPWLACQDVDKSCQSGVSVLLHVDHCTHFPPFAWFVFPLRIGAEVQEQKSWETEREREGWGEKDRWEEEREGERQAPHGSHVSDIMRHDFYPTILVEAVTKSTPVSRRREITDPPPAGVDRFWEGHVGLEILFWPFSGNTIFHCLIQHVGKSSWDTFQVLHWTVGK